MKQIINIILITLTLGILTGCAIQYPSFDPVLNNAQSVVPDATNDPLAWSSQFYRHKDFKRIGNWLAAMDKADLLKYEPGIHYTMGFLIAVLKEHPNETRHLDGQTYMLSVESEKILVYALFYANTPESKAQLRQLAVRRPENQAFIGKGVDEINIQRIYNLTQLNVAFGMFHATGKDELLQLLLHCLSEKDYRKSRSAALIEINDVAIAQFTNNCMTDPEMLRFFEENQNSVCSDLAYNFHLIVRRTEDEKIAAKAALKSDAPSLVVPQIINDPTPTSTLPIRSETTAPRAPDFSRR